MSRRGRVGSDAFATQLVEALGGCGVDVSAVAFDEGVASGVALVVVEPSGENRIIVVPGANGRVTPAQARSAAQTLERGDLFLSQLEVPLNTIEAGARVARERGACVLLNAAPAGELDRALLALVDVLIVNETEAAALVGKPVTGARRMARSLLELGPRSVVVTLGPKGALFAEAMFLHEQPAPLTNVIDTTAAGDAFVGAYAASWLESQDAARALRRGVLAGTLACGRFGARPSLPTKAQIDAFEASLSGSPREVDS